MMDIDRSSVGKIKFQDQHVTIIESIQMNSGGVFTGSVLLLSKPIISRTYCLHVDVSAEFIKKNSPFEFDSNKTENNLSFFGGVITAIPYDSIGIYDCVLDCLMDFLDYKTKKLKTVKLELKEKDKLIEIQTKDLELYKSTKEFIKEAEELSK